MKPTSTYPSQILLINGKHGLGDIEVPVAPINNVAMALWRLGFGSSDDNHFIHPCSRLCFRFDEVCQGKWLLVCMQLLCKKGYRCQLVMTMFAQSTMPCGYSTTSIAAPCWSRTPRSWIFRMTPLSWRLLCHLQSCSLSWPLHCLQFMNWDDWWLIDCFDI